MALKGIETYRVVLVKWVRVAETERMLNLEWGDYWGPEARFL
jgi:hypothetical protein